MRVLLASLALLLVGFGSLCWLIASQIVIPIIRWFIAP